MERIISLTTENNHDFSLAAIAVLAAIMAGWLLQKKCSDAWFDICDEMALNVGRNINNMFNMHDLGIYSSMDKFTFLYTNVINAYKALHEKLILDIHNGIIHPELVELRYMFRHFLIHTMDTQKQVTKFYEAFSKLENPAFIVHYDRYIITVEQFNSHKEVMENICSDNLDSILPLLDQFHNFWA